MKKCLKKTYNSQHPSLTVGNRSDSAWPLPELGSEVEVMGRGQEVKEREKPVEKKWDTRNILLSIVAYLFILFFSHFIPLSSLPANMLIWLRPFPLAAVAMTTGRAWPLCNLSDVEVCPRHHPVPTSGGVNLRLQPQSEVTVRLEDVQGWDEGLCCVLSLGMISNKVFFFFFKCFQPPHLLQLLRRKQQHCLWCKVPVLWTQEPH